MSKRVTLAEQLRNALRQERSLYVVSKVAGLDEGRLSRFMRGERTLTLPTVQKLLDGLKIECRLVRRAQKGR